MYTFLLYHRFGLRAVQQSAILSPSKGLVLLWEPPPTGGGIMMEMKSAIGFVGEADFKGKGMTQPRSTEADLSSIVWMREPGPHPGVALWQGHGYANMRGHQGVGGGLLVK